MTSSPCVRNCCLDSADVCVGCGRTLTEITGWREMSDADRAEIISRLKNAASELERFSAVS